MKNTNSPQKVSITVPSDILAAGLTKEHIQRLVNHWLVISLFKQSKITATQADQLLMTDLDGFLAILDELGIIYDDIIYDNIIYDDIPQRDNLPTRRPPLLAENAKNEGRLKSLKNELAQTKQKLLKAKNQLYEAERLQSEFLATVSHELRTPLNSILGFAKLLLNQTVGPLNQIQHTDVSFIFDSAQHLLSLVNDILDLSKIKAGKIRLDMEWLNVEEIIVGVMASTYILIDNKPIDLKEKIQPKLPKIYVDRGRIRQVVLNILSNAAKFTDQGAITMRISKTTKNEQDFVCFSITDTGIGIAQADMSKVFEAFRQIDSSVARRAEGTGLGMPISYRLIQLHGGELGVESKVGQGSIFYFTIPAQPPNLVHGRDS